MLSVGFLIFGAGVLCVIAEGASSDGSSCPTKNPDGWNFLQPNTQYDMLKRTFKTGGSDDTKCLSSTINQMDQTTRTVQATIKYKNGYGGKWTTIEQVYKLSPDTTGNYNVMNTTDESKPPKASYHFGYTGGFCAVVYVNSIGSVAANSENVPEARTASQESSQRDCVLWVKDASKDQTDPCCEEFFDTQCKKDRYVIYDKDQCVDKAIP
uniref:Lipocalin n=1 Tax=Rhipicephalus zambeziensis TaxID=60191 RepID=A0A224YLH4_9ACAR